MSCSDARIPIISIASPSQASRESEGAAHCLADHSVVSGHIIQPEHSLGDDRTVAIRGKFKEHLITSDVPSPPRQPSPTPHTLDDDVKIAQRADNHKSGSAKQLDGADGEVWDDVTTEFLHHQPEKPVFLPTISSTPDKFPSIDLLSQGEVVELETTSKRAEFANLP